MNRRRQLFFPRSYRAGRHVTAFIAFLAMSSLGAVARDRGATEEEKRACTPDVFRLCSGAIPDVAAIAACLKTKLSSLSVQCRYVMSAHDGTKVKTDSK